MLSISWPTTLTKHTWPPTLLPRCLPSGMSCCAALSDKSPSKHRWCTFIYSMMIDARGLSFKPRFHLADNIGSLFLHSYCCLGSTGSMIYKRLMLICGIPKLQKSEVFHFYPETRLLNFYIFSLCLALRP